MRLKRSKSGWGTVEMHVGACQVAFRPAETPWPDALFTGRAQLSPLTSTKLAEGIVAAECALQGRDAKSLP